MEQSRPPDPRTRTAPAQERARTAPSQPAPARPAAQPTPQSQVSSTLPENLTIAPVLSGAGGSSLAFDWEAVTMGSNRSYAFAVSASDAAQISVTMTQSMYRRSYSGDRILKTGPVPPAPAGTEGSLVARNLSTGESVTYVWRWQPKSAAASAAPPAKGGGLLAKLFSRGKADTASASRAAVKGRPLTLAERLGPRAAQAFTLKFFGQEATGQRFAFVVDKSGSMDGSRWKACRKQLTDAIAVMPPHVEFVVVLFDTAVSEPPQQTNWLKAERAEIEAAMEWVFARFPGGGTYVTPAFQHVFSFPTPPDVIYFLTDGDVSDFSPETCQRVRGSALTVINTIALENAESQEALTAIAEQTGGAFVFIPKADKSEQHE